MEIGPISKTIPLPSQFAEIGHNTCYFVKLWLCHILCHVAMETGNVYYLKHQNDKRLEKSMKFVQIVTRPKQCCAAVKSFVFYHLISASVFQSLFPVNNIPVVPKKTATISLEGQVSELISTILSTDNKTDTKIQGNMVDSCCPTSSSLNYGICLIAAITFLLNIVGGANGAKEVPIDKISDQSDNNETVSDNRCSQIIS